MGIAKKKPKIFMTQGSNPRISYIPIGCLTDELSLKMHLVLISGNLVIKCRKLYFIDLNCWR